MPFETLLLGVVVGAGAVLGAADGEADGETVGFAVGLADADGFAVAVTVPPVD